jgi:hypothetical protein
MIVSLVFNKRYEEAKAILRTEEKTMSRNATLRLLGLNEALEDKVQQVGTSPAAMRRILAGCYMMAEILREEEYWGDAEEIYEQVVKRSVAMDEPFFLMSARMCRAVCLKQLGRKREVEQVKAQIPPGTAILLEDGELRVEDL